MFCACVRLNYCKNGLLCHKRVKKEEKSTTKHIHVHTYIYIYTKSHSSTPAAVVLCSWVDTILENKTTNSKM